MYVWLHAFGLSWNGIGQGCFFPRKETRSMSCLFRSVLFGSIVYIHYICYADAETDMKKD